MIIYFSGGSDIVEVSLPAPAVMLSAYCHAGGEEGTWNPIGRFRTILDLRYKDKKKKGKKNLTVPEYPIKKKPVKKEKK